MSLRFFSNLEKRVMKIIVILVARYYLKKPALSELISMKVTTFKAGLLISMNEICYLLGLEKSFRLTSLSIEVTNHCNLHCLVCPASTRMERQKGFIDENLFQKIIDANASLEFILPFQWGEPLLHPKIFELIRYASAKGIRTMITTNGTICSDQIIQQILDSGLEQLTFSIDGVGSTYTMIRGFDYGQLKANVLKRIKEVLLFLHISPDNVSNCPDKLPPSNSSLENVAEVHLGTVNILGRIVKVLDINKDTNALL